MGSREHFGDQDLDEELSELDEAILAALAKAEVSGLKLYSLVDIASDEREFVTALARLHRLERIEKRPDARQPTGLGRFLYRLAGTAVKEEPLPLAPAPVQAPGKRVAPVKATTVPAKPAKAPPKPKSLPTPAPAPSDLLKLAAPARPMALDFPAATPSPTDSAEAVMPEAAAVESPAASQEVVPGEPADTGSVPPESEAEHRVPEDIAAPASDTQTTPSEPPSDPEPHTDAASPESDQQRAPTLPGLARPEGVGEEDWADVLRAFESLLQPVSAADAKTSAAEIKVIAAGLGVRKATVEKWVSVYRETGVVEIFARKKPEASQPRTNSRRLPDEVDALILQVFGDMTGAGERLHAGKAYEKAKALCEEKGLVPPLLASVRSRATVFNRTLPPELRGKSGGDRNHSHKEAARTGDAPQAPAAAAPAEVQGVGKSETVEAQETAPAAQPVVETVIETATPADPGLPVLGRNLSTRDDVVIDLPKLIETRLLIQAASGGGKSWTLRRLLEQTAPMVQQIIIDPEGEFPSLATWYPYLVFGRDEGSLNFSIGQARDLAQELYKSRSSAIIDLSEVDAEDRDIFVANFLRGLMTVSSEHWHHAMIVLDEAHLFCPQHDKSEAKKPVIDLTCRGRKRGLCPVLATQRIAKLNKSAAAELHNRMIGLTVLDVDLKRSAEELGMPLAQATDVLPQLEPGEFFVYGPALTRRVSPVKVGEVHTKHGHLDGQVTPPTVASDDVKAFLSEIAAGPKPAESESPAPESTDAAASAGANVPAPRPAPALTRKMSATPFSYEDGQGIVAFLEARCAYSTQDQVQKAMSWRREALIFHLMRVLQLTGPQVLALRIDSFKDDMVRHWQDLPMVKTQAEAAQHIRRRINDYVENVRPLIAGGSQFIETDRLFITNRGTAMSEPSLYARFKDMITTCRLEDQGYSLSSIVAI